MLKINDISYSVPRKDIIRNITTEFLPGEFTMILGPNGSGKSTLLKVFSGELKTQKGHVTYNNTDLAKLKKDHLAKFRAVMSQQPELAFPLTVHEVVMMGRYPHFTFNPGEKDENICNEVLSMMSLKSFVDRNYLTLSGGEKQRVQFARVLAQIWETENTTNRYLFLDEPLTNLDINYQQEFLRLSKGLLNDHTVLVAVMHDINLAVQFADKIIFLKDGQIAAAGKPSEVLTTELINEVFGVHTRFILHPVNGLPVMVYE